jgi:DNA-binding response OmpR family regulator
MTVILLVEDDAFLGLDLEAMLADAGYAVIGPAMTVREAEKLLDEQRVDAAILDLNLGEERSDPIADRLDEAGTPFFFLTGHAREELPERHKDRSIVSKPFSDAALLKMLEDLCDAE